MKTFQWTLTALMMALGLLVLASTSATAQDEPTSEPSNETIELTEEGSVLDPLATSDQIPVGAWYCDMGGSVHYASLTEGDGSCPVCGMFLSQKAEPEAEPTEADSMPGHHGHEH